MRLQKIRPPVKKQHQSTNIEAFTVTARQRRDRLASRAEIVDQAFKSTETSLAAYVEDATDEIDANRRATRSLGLARMRARFNQLHDSLTAADNTGSHAKLRADLDTFATQFAPLLDFAIGDERRTRRDILHSLEILRERMIVTALMIGALAVLALVLFTNNGCVQVNRGDIPCVFPRDSSTPGYAGGRSCSVVTAALSSS